MKIDTRYEGPAPLRVGVVGCGYWGPNLVRNFHQINDAVVTWVADRDPSRLARMQELYPDVRATTEVEDLLRDPELDAVVLALPVHLHHPLGMAALEAGKHLFVEKPLATSSRECLELIEAAEARGLTLMVGHVFEYTEAVRAAKALIDAKELGELYYIRSERLNLGRFQSDINVIWDLAPHDFSILLHVLDGQQPVGVRAVGSSNVSDSVADVAHVTLEFENGPSAFMHFSWLDPKKVRQTVFVGREKMLVYDDIEANQKLWLYDCGVETPEAHETFDEFPYTYRYGDIVIPRVPGGEPLREEARHFVECVRYGKQPLSDGRSGLRVVRILEATDRSLACGGAQVALDDAEPSAPAARETAHA